MKKAGRTQPFALLFLFFLDDFSVGAVLQYSIEVSLSCTGYGRIINQQIGGG
jgi:hypothetical protein